MSKKDKSTKKIKALDYRHSHSDGKPMWSHCVVTSHYKIAEYSLLLNLKLYLRKHYFGKKAKKYFKNKKQLTSIINYILNTPIFPKIVNDTVV